LKNALNGASSDMKVNGSLATPIVFTIPAEVTKDVFIEEIRFYGNANGIKFGQFLAQNNALTNGILVEAKSDDAVTQLPLLYSTDDLKHKFSFGPGSGFQLHVQAGRDDFMASFRFSASVPIRKVGTYTTDDYIKVSIRDNLTAGIQTLEFIAIGFQEEP
jgi:hypothetical protein